MRLGRRQQEILRMIAVHCEPVSDHAGETPSVVPFNIGKTGWTYFDSTTERTRFYKRLEDLGLIRIERDYFVYITTAGRAAAEAATAKDSA